MEYVWKCIEYVRYMCGMHMEYVGFTNEICIEYVWHIYGMCVEHVGNI